MKLDFSQVKKLEHILTQELAQYGTYLTLLDQEQKGVVALKSDRVAALSQQRSKVADTIAQLRAERLEFVESVSGTPGVRLSDVLEEACEPGDRKRLLTLVQQMRDKLAIVEKKSSEFTQVLNFSLGLVNGEISILWSASQTVNRVYNSFGALTESAQPAAPRAGSLLGEA